MPVMGWMDDTPLLAKNTVLGGQLASFPTEADLWQVSASSGQCRVAAQRGELSRALCRRAAPGAGGKSPASYWAASLLVLQGPIDWRCMTILLQEPYFLLFSTIFPLHRFEELEVFRAGIILSFKFRICSGWVSVPQFLLLVSHYCNAIINKRTGCKKPQELQPSE